MSASVEVKSTGMQPSMFLPQVLDLLTPPALLRSRRVTPATLKQIIIYVDEGVAKNGAN